ncbi:MAG TPA: hypothetical protein PK850_10780 [Ignavibacteria bacterium]|nr:hypothetical protein [Bacteroidota bacterium]HRE09874.1 hypothetical protein [Ignavibacteria bacterium]HRF66437.1 hypothetical protein [Ignavibacteria bacterium]
MKDIYPFIYINHGKPLDIYSFQGEKYFVFCFKEKISSETAEAVENIVPEVLAGSVIWSGNLLMLYSMSDEDEITGHYLAKKGESYEADYSNKMFLELFAEFANDIESWAKKTNEVAPLDFFIGMNRISGSKWDKYSDKKLPEIIEKLLQAAEENSPRKNKIINQALHILFESKNKLIPANLRSRAKKIMQETN